MKSRATISDQVAFLRGVWTVASIAGADGLDRLSALHVSAHCDILEIRVDGWPDRAAAAVPAIAACGVPVLLTVRSPAEGGMNSLTDQARRGLIRTLLPVAAMLDVEIASMEALADVCSAAREQGVVVVASFHDFSGCPETAVLYEKIHHARAAGADIVKLAVTPQNTAELASLAGLLEAAPGPLSLMGMGPLGPVSRLLCAQLGSVLNYGFLDRPTVPGQWPAARLRSLIAELRAL